MQQWRHDQTDCGQDFEGADALHLGIAEVGDVGHLAGQREAWTRQLVDPRSQKSDSQDYLDDPKRDVHTNLLPS